MAFLLSYLAYVVACALGAGLAWVAARRFVPATSAAQALANRAALLDEEASS